MGPVSIRRRLTVLLLAGAAALSLGLWLLTRATAERAVVETQDGILRAVTLAVAEGLRAGPAGIEVDLPFSAFSILGAVGQDRIYYRIDVGARTVTGYPDLPLPETAGVGAAVRGAQFRGAAVRVAAVERRLLLDGRDRTVRVAVAHGQRMREGIVADLSARAGLVGLGFFALAALLAVLTARAVTDPIRRLASAVARRGPDDLRPVGRRGPAELQPLVAALDGLMGRLDGSLARTETFIAEAAHHVRTPLSALRARAEVALRAADPATRDHLRAILRLSDATARTAGQMLDHAAVAHRSEQGAAEAVDLSQLARDVARAMAPVAEMRDVALRLDAPGPVMVRADRVPLEAAIRNLVDNAVKYSPDEAAIEIATAADPPRLWVRDRGRGLDAPPDALKARFARGANAGDVVGTGLGLSIADDVARASGGTLALSPRDGGGTCATLSWP